MRAAVKSAEGKALLQAALDARDTLKPLDEDFLQEIQAGDIKAAKDTLLQRSRPAQLAVIAALKKLSEYQRTKIHVKAEEVAAAYQSTRTTLITLSLAAVAGACLLAFLLSLAFRKPLSRAVAVLGEIEKGNYVNTVTASSQDEIGQTLQGLERMQVALRDRTEKEHASAMENARIRTALDRVSVGAMLGDTDGKIIYMNDALRGLFGSQSAEIRRHVPSFDLEHLVGSSFDVFHQIPSLQRNALAGLTGSHTADVKMGERPPRKRGQTVSDRAGLG